MVRLDRIYTRSGDAGQTSLGDGSRVNKTAPRLEVMGTVDEVNSHLGLAVCSTDSDSLRTLLERLQQLLFDLGADLCCPLPTDPADDKCPRIDPKHVLWLEQQIDLVTEQLQPLTSFVLPGGSQTAAALHVARSVCRRAERDFQHLLVSDEANQVNVNVGTVLNRLSDLFFVLARQANNNGTDDVQWVPGSTLED